MSNSMDPDQARRIVGPDLGPNWKGYRQTTLVDKELRVVQTCLWGFLPGKTQTFFLLGAVARLVAKLSTVT